MFTWYIWYISPTPNMAYLWLVCGITVLNYHSADISLVDLYDIVTYTWYDISLGDLYDNATYPQE